MKDLDQVLVWTFVTVNSIRALAYAPQILAAIRQPEGARSISLLTWGYFALAHFTGALYSWRITGDAKLMGVFVTNFLACAALVAVVSWQRARARASFRLAA